MDLFKNIVSLSSIKKMTKYLSKTMIYEAEIQYAILF